MMTYEIHLDKFDDVIACDSCGLPVPTAEFDSWQQNKKGPYHYCQFCATTDASNRITFPYQCEETRIIAQTWKAAATVYNCITFPKLVFQKQEDTGAQVIEGEDA